ncbi:PfkB family carbohydrate kinase [Sanguibacter sp. 25GB23B1]|uniref:PfkB family carbohydrate kinase n=1 Tax=unclassified Sanguibacter TaxID=2645534 RepID=UPI0032AFAE17
MRGSAEDVPARGPRTVPVGIFGGLTTLDVVHRSERAPRRNEKATASRQDVSAGGPAANAAVVFAALGGHARLVTALGTGAVARIARDDLESHGVEVVDVTPGSAVELGVSAIRVDPTTGDRSVLSMDGAGRSVPAGPELDAETSDLVADADLVLLDGHHPALAEALAHAAQRIGAPIVVDAGRWRPVMAQLLPAARTIIASDDFRWHDGTEPDRPGVRAPWSALAHVQQVVTHGAAPFEWWTGGESGHVPVPTVQVVDTLGAGDAFHGAFAYYAARSWASSRTTGPTGSDALAHDALLPEHLAAAADVAAFRCSVVGPRDWLRSLPVGSRQSVVSRQRR